MSLARAEIAELQRRLLGWFRCAKRDLPWRRTRNPYRIWLSEIMLQQTRVAAVVPYYRRFLARFPSVRALARARTNAVLKLWAGLGYYGRARNLHRAAREIVARHSGRFPRELNAALGLPGIGRYTAAAVLSIAYGAPHAVLDGNVARVLARLGAIRGDLRAPRRWKQLQSNAQALLALPAPGDWNQAMMELGATVCTPRAPRCGDCPIARWCRAYRLGIANDLPAARKKRIPVEVSLAAAVLLDPRGHTLLVKHGDGKRARHDGVLFSRLWQFPAAVVSNESGAELARHLGRVLGLEGMRLVPLPTLRHAVTFREMKLAPFLIRVKRLPQIKGARTPRLTQVDDLPVSSATRKIAATAMRIPNV